MKNHLDIYERGNSAIAQRFSFIIRRDRAQENSLKST
jgi:hypothetical protein